MVVLQIRLDGSSSMRHFYVIHDEKEALVNYVPEARHEISKNCALTPL